MFFFVYILKQRRKKFRGLLKKNSRIFKIFKNFTKIKTFKHKFLKFWSFIKLPWGHVMSYTKLGPDRFSRYDVYWIQANRQTDRQAKFIYRRRQIIGTNSPLKTPRSLFYPVYLRKSSLRTGSYRSRDTGCWV